MFLTKFSKSPKQLQQALEQWELATCKGSECYNRQEFKQAIVYFENALIQAELGLAKEYRQGDFMQYYTLASMNLADALISNEKQFQSEKVLSDAHFNMLSLMMDKKNPNTFRREAKEQAEMLMSRLKKFLVNIGKNKVAESLEEEFYRLKLNSNFC